MNVLEHEVLLLLTAIRKATARYHVHSFDLDCSDRLVVANQNYHAYVSSCSSRHMIANQDAQSADACQSERSHAWSELSQSADCQLVRSRVSSALHFCQAEDEDEVDQVQDEHFHLVEFHSSSLFFRVFCLLDSSILFSPAFDFSDDIPR